MTSSIGSPVHRLVPTGWAKSRLRRFSDVLPCMLYEYVMLPSGQRELLYVGSKCRELLELDEKDLLKDANLFAALVLEEDLPRLMAEDVAASLDGGCFTSDVRIRTRSGCVKWVQLSSGPNPPTDSGIVVWSGFMIDITERKQMEEQVRELAFHDPLTNLPNRRMLNDHLNKTMSKNNRSGAFGALMVLDLDNFKALNDEHGHLVGDLLLIEAANRLKNSVRAMDTVGRFGGDEFVVMLSELSLNESEARRFAGEVAEKIRLSIATPFTLAAGQGGLSDAPVQHVCTASIGLVLFKGEEFNHCELVMGADAAMYSAKHAGRNRFHFGTPVSEQPRTPSLIASIIC